MVSNFSRIEKISSQELANEWDCLATERHNQIYQGLDITFNHVMIPLVESLVGQNKKGTLIDIGSGTGELTKHLATCFEKVICIEPSIRSMEIAASLLSIFSNINYINSDFEDCGELLCIDPDKKNVFLAAMMLSANPQLDRFAEMLSKAAHAGDEFIATIPHPCFWPRYWGYEKESWFSYDKEIMVKAPFKISLSNTGFKSTHIHRPIEKYIAIFSKNGFRLVNLVEPMPSQKIQALYPRKWEYPRFLAFKWVKN